MPNIINIAPSLFINDFLTASDFDMINIKIIDIYHEDSSLNIYLNINIHEYFCPMCTKLTNMVKSYQFKKIKHPISHPVSCIIHYRALRFVCPVFYKLECKQRLLYVIIFTI